jgi:DNA-binding Xre family transcriptional regulator
VYYLYVKKGAQQMIKIKIAELAAKRHNVTSAYQLQNFLNISPSIASRLWKGDFDKIGINTINKLCYRLKCQPNDFIEYVDKRGERPTNDGYVTKAKRLEGVTSAQKAKGWGNPRNKKSKDEPQTDNTLLNNSLFDNAQSNNTKSDITQMKHVPQSNNTEISKTQSVSDNENLLPSADKRKAKNFVSTLPELPNDDKWLRANEIAERLGKPSSTIRDYCNKQGLAHTRVGMVNFIKESDLNAFLANRKTRAKHTPQPVENLP